MALHALSTTLTSSVIASLYLQSAQDMAAADVLLCGSHAVYKPVHLCEHKD